MLPRDLSQQIFNELICTQALTRASLQAFQDCALQDVLLGEYPGVDDSWLEVLAMQDSSLLAVDVSGSAVTDSGLALVQDCSNLQSLNFNYCDYISNVGLQYLSSLTNLTSLSFKRSNAITAAGLCALVGLLNLTSLDLNRCSGIHGGLVHLKALTKLESLNIGWCNCIKNSDIKPLAGLANLKELQISRSKVTDSGIASLKGMKKFSLLNMEDRNINPGAQILQQVVSSLKKEGKKDRAEEVMSMNKTYKLVQEEKKEVHCEVDRALNVESQRLDEAGRTLLKKKKRSKTIAVEY